MLNVQTHPLTTIVLSTLREIGWHAEPHTSEDAGPSIFEIAPGEIPSQTGMILKVSESGRYLLLVRFLPFQASDETRHEVADLMNSINLHLTHDRFTIDFRFEGSPMTVRSDLTICDGELTPSQVRDLVSPAGDHAELWPYLISASEGEGSASEIFTKLTLELGTAGLR